eukprot:SAG31_NODE_455_length_15433_cov_4.248728_15_plen_496_part_00
MAFLLGSFSLGYVPLQIPYSLLARRTGQKLLCTINLLAQAAGCALLPAAAGRGPGCLSAVLAVLGVFQGSRVPCVQVLQRRWVPDGLERVRFQQVTMWAGQAATLCHFSAIPLLAQWFGWRVLPRWYALQSLTMAALWHAFAADSPAEWQGPVPMTAEEFQLLHQIGRDGEVAAPANSGQQPQLEHSGVVMQDEPPPQEGLEGCSQSAPQQHPLSSEQSAVRAAVGSVGRNTQPTLSMEAASEQQMRRQHWQPGGDATEAAVLLVDKNLPPLSLRQLFTIRQMQGSESPLTNQCRLHQSSQPRAWHWCLPCVASIIELVSHRLLRWCGAVLAMCLVECSFPTFTKVQALWTLYFSERYSLPMEHVRKTQAVSEAETPHAAFGACFIQSEFCALHTIGWQVLLRQTALMAPMAVVASLLEGVVETTLIRRGWETIDIRRGSSTAGYLLQILLKLGDIFAPTANLAFAVQFCNVFVGPLHQAGFNLSGREMGGEESG